MEPLQTNQKLLTWYCVRPVNSKLKTCIYGVFTVTMALSIASVFYTSVLYCMKFILIDLESTLYAVYQVITAQSMVYIIVSSFLVREKFNKIFSGLKKIYKSCNVQHFENSMNVKIIQKNQLNFR